MLQLVQQTPEEVVEVAEGILLTQTEVLQEMAKMEVLE
tara:strand:- start:159 stop:272 length:114 start_codon:yes stop_codon:yes gene_type:complete